MDEIRLCVHEDRTYRGDGKVDRWKGRIIKRKEKRKKDRSKELRIEDRIYEISVYHSGADEDSRIVGCSECQSDVTSQTICVWFVSALPQAINFLPSNAEARDQGQLSSVANFSVQVALEMVSYAAVLLIFLVIIILHCSIFIHLSIMGAI